MSNTVAKRMKSCAKCQIRWTEPNMHCRKCHYSWCARDALRLPRWCARCQKRLGKKKKVNNWWGSDDPGWLWDRHLKKAIALGVPHDGPIYLMQIYKRDQGICGICGKAVPMNGKGRLGWSLDHIISMSLGGPHLRWNVQLAHRGCNSRKRNRIHVSIPAPTIRFNFFLTERRDLTA